MGRKLIINGADFSKYSVDKVTEGPAALFPSMTSVVNNQAGWFIIYNNNTRLTITNEHGRGIRLPAGYKVTLNKLKGNNGSRTALWLDYIMYSTPEIPMAYDASFVSQNCANLLKTGSEFNSENYFPLNHANEASIDVENPYDHDVYIVFVAKAGSAGSVITVSQYSGSVSGIKYAVTPING